MQKNWVMSCFSGGMSGEMCPKGEYNDVEKLAPKLATCEGVKKPRPPPDEGAKKLGMRDELLVPDEGASPGTAALL